MLEVMSDLPAGVAGVRIHGTITAAEYREVMRRLLDGPRREGRPLRLLVVFAGDFTGFTAGAALEDAKLALRSWRRDDRIAVVADVPWIRHGVRLLDVLIPMEVRDFSRDDEGAALVWLAEPAHEGLEVHLDEALGVVVVEPHGRIRDGDFTALARMVDAYLENHELRGVVIHARSIPGWESFTALQEHVRFVREHHRRVGRVAIAGGGAILERAPALARHFVAAELRHFAHDELAAAIAWAAEGHAVGAL